MKQKNFSKNICKNAQFYEQSGKMQIKMKIIILAKIKRTTTFIAAQGTHIQCPLESLRGVNLAIIIKI